MPEWLGYPFQPLFRAPLDGLDRYDVTAPIIADGVAVVFGRAAAHYSQFDVIDIDARTGQRRWVWHIPEELGKPNRPTVSEGKVYITTWKGRVVALNLQQGAVLWQSEQVTYSPDVTVNESFGTSAGRVGQIVVAGGIHSVVHAVSAATGARAWAFGAARDGGIVRDVQTAGDKVFVKAVGLNHTHYSAVDAAGNLLWTHDFAEFDLGRMIAVDDTLYIVHSYNKVMALNAASGQVRWEQSLPGVVELGWATVGDGLVFVPTSRKTQAGQYQAGLTALRASSGEIAWQLQQGWAPYDWTTPTASDIVYARALYTSGVVWMPYQGRLAAIDPRNGEILWASAVSGLGSAYSSLVPYGGNLYAVQGGELIAYRGTGAATIAREPVYASPAAPVAPVNGAGSGPADLSAGPADTGPRMPQLSFANAQAALDYANHLQEQIQADPSLFDKPEVRVAVDQVTGHAEGHRRCWRRVHV